MVEVFGIEVERPYAGIGRYPRPVKVPREDLKYVQVVKHRQGIHLVSVERRIVYGDPNEIMRILKKSAMKINTSYVERQNLSVRHYVRRFTRKTISFSKSWNYLDDYLEILQGWFNFIKPHQSLRKRKRGRYPRYEKRTPAMAQGLTDHIWTWEKFLHWKKNQYN